MLSNAEVADVAAHFGVTEEQVRRDHLISHLLHALASLDLPLTFFGGTALARTHLTEPSTGGRMSEDIDLHTPERSRSAAALDETLPRALRREFPGLIWDLPLSRVKHLQPATLMTPDGIRLRVQLIDSADHHELSSWPSERHQIELRYSDLPASVTTRVPTLPAFVRRPRVGVVAGGRRGDEWIQRSDRASARARSAWGGSAVSRRRYQGEALAR